MKTKVTKLFLPLIFCALSAVAAKKISPPSLPNLPPYPPGFESEMSQRGLEGSMMNSGTSVPFPEDGGTGGGGYDTNYFPRPDYPTNVVWVDTSLSTNGAVGISVHNIQVWGTNRVLALLSNPDLNTNQWNVEQDFHSGTNSLWSTSVSPNQPNLFLRVADWTDLQTNGLPLWWEWEQFGRTDLDPNSDPGGSGNSLIYNYQNGLDPNKIQFSLSISNEYVNFNPVPIQLNVSGGIPFNMAVMVDSTNFATANWMDYTPTLQVDLGSEGWHTVWVGLRGRLPSSQQNWSSIRFKLGYAAPLLVITNPVLSTIAQPMVQIQGFCSKPLASISYDLSNAAGHFTNQQALVIHQYYDAKTWEFTTNTFQAFDVRLTNGPNVITLRAADLAGNITTTNLTLTVNYATKTNPPAIQLYWPKNGMEISGNSFTFRGWVDDFTATIRASIVDTNGTTNTTSAIIERDGKFWVEGLPLGGGTNRVTLIVTDAAGNINTTNITVIQNATVLRMNSVLENQLWQPTVNVTGTISNPTLSVWVNGLQGVNNGNGTWSADNVPVNSGGTAVFSLTASGSQSTNILTAEQGQEKPSGTYTLTYAMNADYETGDTRDNMDANGNLGNWTDEANQLHADQTWTDGLGGTNLSWYSYRKDDNYSSFYQKSTTETTWPAVGMGTRVFTDVYPDFTNHFNEQVEAPLISYEHCGFKDHYDVTYTNSTGNGAYRLVRTTCHYAREAQTTVRFRAGGKAKPGETNVFVISASATQVVHGDAQRDFAAGAWPTEREPSLPTQPLPPHRTAVMGRLLDADGTTTVPLPNGAESDLTVRVLGVDFFMFNVSAAPKTP